MIFYFHFDTLYVLRHMPCSDIPHEIHRVLVIDIYFWLISASGLVTDAGLTPNGSKTFSPCATSYIVVPIAVTSVHEHEPAGFEPASLSYQGEALDMK